MVTNASKRTFRSTFVAALLASCSSLLRGTRERASGSTAADEAAIAEFNRQLPQGDQRRRHRHAREPDDRRAHDDLVRRTAARRARRRSSTR